MSLRLWRRQFSVIESSTIRTSTPFQFDRLECQLFIHPLKSKWKIQVLAFVSELSSKETRLTEVETYFSSQFNDIKFQTSCDSIYNLPPEQCNVNLFSIDICPSKCHFRLWLKLAKYSNNVEFWKAGKGNTSPGARKQEKNSGKKKKKWLLCWQIKERMG